MNVSSHFLEIFVEFDPFSRRKLRRLEYGCTLTARNIVEVLFWLDYKITVAPLSLCIQMSSAISELFLL